MKALPINPMFAAVEDNNRILAADNVKERRLRERAYGERPGCSKHDGSLGRRVLNARKVK